LLWLVVNNRLVSCLELKIKLKNMISYLKWKIITLDFTKLTVLTETWVWYEVWINELTYSKLSLEEDIELFIYHHITDNTQSLFWFLNFGEKNIFEKLIKISWIGWKVAQQILSMWTSRFLNAIESEDNKTMEWTKWVWKKMAEKIILELKDKDFWIRLEQNITSQDKNYISWDLYDSIKSTLLNMWYNSKDIDKKLRELPKWLTEAWEIIPYLIRELS